MIEHMERRLASLADEDGAVGTLIIGIIIGVALVIFLIVQLFQAIF